jgi:hypothetical protein
MGVRRPCVHARPNIVGSVGNFNATIGALKMSSNIETDVFGSSSERYVWVMLKVEVDERFIDTFVENPFFAPIYTEVPGPEPSADLQRMDEDLMFQDTIERMSKTGGVHLEFARKDQDGDDLYRVV